MIMTDQRAPLGSVHASGPVPLDDESADNNRISIKPAFHSRLPHGVRVTLYSIAILGGPTSILATVSLLTEVEITAGLLAGVAILTVVFFVLAIWLGEHFHVKSLNLLHDRHNGLVGEIVEKHERTILQLTEETGNLHTELKGATKNVESVEFTLNVARRINDEIAAYHHSTGAEKLGSFIQRACDGMQASYANTGIKAVRVCLKQVEEAVGTGQGPYVSDVYRSNEAVPPNPRSHPIDRNTDFRQLYRGEKKYWFTGHRSAYPDYVTTSHNPTYESVIVWPMIPRTLSTDESITDEEFTNMSSIKAFLCLDSEDLDAFDDADVTTGWILADALSRAYEVTHNWEE